MTENNAFFGIHEASDEQQNGTTPMIETEIQPENNPDPKPEEETKPIPAAEEKEKVMPIQPASDEKSANPNEHDGTLEVLSGKIERESQLIDSLIMLTQDLVAKVETLTQKLEDANDEQAKLKQEVLDSRLALNQYIRTNSLPHDVLKILQTENEKMIRKLEIRPQTDILRAIRDFYCQMRRDRQNYEISGDTTVTKLLDLLMITLQQDIMEDHGVEILESAEGIPFKALRMEKAGTVPTAEKEKHMHVAKSAWVGFQFDKEVLLKERVVLYEYDHSLEAKNAAAEETPVEETLSDAIPAEEAIIGANTADSGEEPIIEQN